MLSKYEKPFELIWHVIRHEKADEKLKERIVFVCNFIRSLAMNAYPWQASIAC
jgi:hypothetical protein